MRSSHNTVWFVLCYCWIDIKKHHTLTLTQPIHLIRHCLFGYAVTSNNSLRSIQTKSGTEVNCRRVVLSVCSKPQSEITSYLSDSPALHLANHWTQTKGQLSYLFLVKLPTTRIHPVLSPPHIPHLSNWSLEPMMPSQPVRTHFPFTHTELL